MEKDEQKKLAYVRANEMLVDLNGGADLQNKKSVRVSRTDGAPVDVLVAAFRNPVGTNTIVPGTDAFYVLSVNGITEPKSDSAKMETLAKEMEHMAQKNVMDDLEELISDVENFMKLNNENDELTDEMIIETEVGKGTTIKLKVFVK